MVTIVSMEREAMAAGEWPDDRERFLEMQALFFRARVKSKKGDAVSPAYLVEFNCDSL
jgi:hypothetical protein